MPNWNEIINDLEKKAAEAQRLLEHARLLAQQYNEESTNESSSRAFGVSKRRAPAPRPVSRGAGPIAEMTMKQAIRTALAAAYLEGHGLSPSAIASWFRAHGRQGDLRKSISAQLSHLKGAGEVRNLGHGEWVLVNPSEGLRLLSAAGLAKKEGSGL